MIRVGWPCLTGWWKSHTKCPNPKPNKKATKEKNSPAVVKHSKEIYFRYRWVRAIGGCNGTNYEVYREVWLKRAKGLNGLLELKKNTLKIFLCSIIVHSINLVIDESDYIWGRYSNTMSCQRYRECTNLTHGYDENNMLNSSVFRQPWR